jgi:hypothetical protein
MVFGPNLHSKFRFPIQSLKVGPCILYNIFLCGVIKIFVLVYLNFASFCPELMTFFLEAGPHGQHLA